MHLGVTARSVLSDAKYKLSGAQRLDNDTVKNRSNSFFWPYLSILLSWHVHELPRGGLSGLIVRALGPRVPRKR